MKLSSSLEKAYTTDCLSAREAQRQAEFIAFGPIVFQVSRLMLKFGILELLRNSDEGMTIKELAEATKLSEYAVKVLVEASLSIGIVIVNPAEERYELTKTGWFLINDPATRVNLDFNHDVCYEGWFHLDEALKQGKPAGLKHFGDWQTIYEGLSSLPQQAQKSWFAFDHFYSDSSFDEALPIVFKDQPCTLLDVGGNTGRWALRCVGYDKDVNVTIVDLPQQIKMMSEKVADAVGKDRIHGYGMDLLDSESTLPDTQQWDVVWMSQFLDCFNSEQVVSILRRVRRVMSPQTRLYIMETIWDRQRFEPAAMCLTLTSLYFTAMANGNSKMFNTDDLLGYIDAACLQVEHIHDALGQGHSIIQCKIKE